ncbi:fructose-2,6-bisphosphatase TIGAR [Hyperolius riggenbachi]|uniref:fructose-2,6-bisphosphatase TIGAR n=1 Tax=Hyperolius riggenbachi TaxID=752182 RepID=UPI0035A27304
MARFALTVVRHGETRYNKEKLLQGQGIDEPLSDIGFKQAEAAGRFLSGVKFTHVFSSDLIRAKQTACTIMKNNQHSEGVLINYDARLRERRYGVAEGRPLSELKTMAKKSGEQCPSYTPPGGETLDEVRARAKDFFEFLCQFVADEASTKDLSALGASGRERTLTVDLTPFASRDTENQSCYPGNGDVTLDANVLLVSHGAYMRNWIKYLFEDLRVAFPAGVKKSRELSVSPNTGISHFIISLKPGEIGKPDIRCVCINRHDHLADINIDTSHYVV